MHFFISTTVIKVGMENLYPALGLSTLSLLERVRFNILLSCPADGGPRSWFSRTNYSVPV